MNSEHAAIAAIIKREIRRNEDLRSVRGNATTGSVWCAMNDTGLRLADLFFNEDNDPTGTFRQDFIEAAGLDDPKKWGG
jgi:hypothetical protein